MKRTILFTAIVSVLSIGAYANTVVTSQTYVDAQDALKVDIAQGVGTNNANVGKTLVVNSSGNLELGAPAAGNYVEDSITDGVTNKAPSENAVHDALAGKQDIISAGSFGANNSVVTYDATAGDVQERLILHPTETIDEQVLKGDFARGDFFDDSAQLMVIMGEATEQQLKDAIVPAEYILHGLKYKQYAIEPGTTGSVAIFNGADQRGGSRFTERAIYDGTTTYDSTTDANKLITAGAVETKQNKMTCTRWIDNAAHTDANCLLWNMAN